MSSMKYLVPDAKVDYKGEKWTALSIDHSRWLDYPGPSVVESTTGGGRLYAEPTIDGRVNLYEILTEQGKTTYGQGPVGKQGRLVGAGTCKPADVVDAPGADVAPEEGD